MIPEVCAPSKTVKKYSCYNDDDLQKLKQKYNKTYRKKIRAKSPYLIWKGLHRLKCPTESCFSTKLNMHTTRFAPKSPREWIKKPTAWLSSDDITKVLRQYEVAYPEFKYIGPSPSDFYFRENGTCVWEELCKFNVHEISKTKKKVGIVFNLDIHSGGGTHWIGIFMDLTSKKMYYFDSTGSSIHSEPHIHKFYEKVKEQDPSYLLIENKVEHQKGNTECGMYTLFFIIVMLQSGKFSYFQKNVFPDKSMVTLRKKLFNK